MKPRMVFGQPSWQFAIDVVEASLTCRGGHLAPVYFRLGRRKVQPFAIAPWAGTRLPPGHPSALEVLRGAFFCLPFGNEVTPDPQRAAYPLHGHTANRRWRRPRLTENDRGVTLRVECPVVIRPGRVEKELTLRPGHTALYCRHVIRGMSGPVTFAHHPTLQCPLWPGAALISTSATRFGQVFPHRSGDPDREGYYALKTGAWFRALDRVPAATGGTTDVSAYPARNGYDDIVMMASQPVAPFAWSAVSFPDEGYVWFSLKDPRVLASTQLWLANGGQHSVPWNGRVRAVLGVEECTSYFTDGVRVSARPNSFSRRGHPTCLRVSSKQPLVVNFIMGVAAIPRRFGRVAAIAPHADGITLTGTTGVRVVTQVDHNFLAETP